MDLSIIDQLTEASVVMKLRIINNYNFFFLVPVSAFP